MHQQWTHRIKIWLLYYTFASDYKAIELSHDLLFQLDINMLYRYGKYTFMEYYIA